MQPSAPALKKALVYLGRVQNRRESNDQPWVNQGPNDGGFLYEAQGETKTAGGITESYGAMTYAGNQEPEVLRRSRKRPARQGGSVLDWRALFGERASGHGHRVALLRLRTMAMTLDAYGIKTI